MASSIGRSERERVYWERNSRMGVQGHTVDCSALCLGLLLPRLPGGGWVDEEQLVFVVQTLSFISITMSRRKLNKHFALASRRCACVGADDDDFDDCSFPEICKLPYLNNLRRSGTC
jgi:hypothetical protein